MTATYSGWSECILRGELHSQRYRRYWLEAAIIRNPYVDIFHDYSLRIPQPFSSWWQNARTSPFVLLTTRRQETGSRSPTSITSGHKHSRKRFLERSHLLRPLAWSRAPSGVRILQVPVRITISAIYKKNGEHSPSNFCDTFYQPTINDQIWTGNLHPSNGSQQVVFGRIRLIHCVGDDFWELGLFLNPTMAFLL